MKSACYVAALIIFQCNPSRADQFKIITFSYPPYTYSDGRDGIAIQNVRQAFEKAGHSITVEYYPIARAFQYFLSDHEALFAGHISQFSQNTDLGYAINIHTVHKLLVRKDFDGNIISAKVLAVLRDDQVSLEFARKNNIESFSVDNNEQATEMLLAGRLDLLACLGTECDSLIMKNDNNLKVLNGYEEKFDLHIVYHKNSISEANVREIDRKGFLKSP